MTSYFVDEYKQKEIPTITVWHDLSFNELLEVRDMLVERQQAYQRNPELWKQIQVRLDYVADLIHEKSK